MDGHLGCAVDGGLSRGSGWLLVHCPTGTGASNSFATVGCAQAIAECIPAAISRESSFGAVPEA
ncbi:unnamed protein product [Durusdinium trenchii]|uniref:Uncharacterized protein n=1 Tax=Durusdinium trenchii TaxID=1381693 RepID=A0ABP0ND13_9DINO